MRAARGRGRGAVDAVKNVYKCRSRKKNFPFKRIRVV